MTRVAAHEPRDSVWPLECVSLYSARRDSAARKDTNHLRTSSSTLDTHSTHIATASEPLIPPCPQSEFSQNSTPVSACMRRERARLGFQIGERRARGTDASKRAPCPQLQGGVWVCMQAAGLLTIIIWRILDRLGPRPLLGRAPRWQHAADEEPACASTSADEVPTRLR
jgi:hypothetical protein